MSSLAKRSDLLDQSLPHDRQRADQIRTAAQQICSTTGVEKYDLFVVCGSGLADSLDRCGEVIAEIDMGDLPLFIPAAKGHGHLLRSMRISTLDGVCHLLVATGRIHIYEGYMPADIVQLARIAAMTGIDAAVLTNAGGCLRDWSLGEVMRIKDHVNLSGISPFTGPVFVDISHVWDEEIRQWCLHADRDGIYAICRGPEFQTVAESVAMRDAYGIDMVGMSTIMEAIALHQMDVKVAGLSIVADLSFADEPCRHDQVLRAVQSGAVKVAHCVASIAERLISRRNDE